MGMGRQCRLPFFQFTVELFPRNLLGNVSAIMDVCCVFWKAAPHKWTHLLFMSYQVRSFLTAFLHAHILLRFVCHCATYWCSLTECWHRWHRAHTPSPPKQYDILFSLVVHCHVAPNSTGMNHGGPFWCCRMWRCLASRHRLLHVAELAGYFSLILPCSLWHGQSHKLHYYLCRKTEQPVSQLLFVKSYLQEVPL